MERVEPMDRSLRAVRAAALLSLVLLLAAVFLTACEKEAREAPSAEVEAPIQTIYGYHTVETHLGVVRWELFGVKAQRYSGDEDLHLFTVKMLFYEDGQLSATLTSQKAKVNENTHDMVAQGDVHIVTEDGRTLSSEVLYWDNERQLIHTDLFFRATDGDQVLTGIGLETDPKMTDLVVKERVEGDAAEARGPSGGGGPR